MNPRNKPHSELPGQILAYLKEHPGAQLYSIVEAVGFSRGAVTYQIRNLVTDGHITTGGSGGNTRYFLKSARYSREQMMLFAFQANPVKEKLLRHLRKHPGMSREELSETLGIKEGTLYRHLSAMQKAGILSRTRDGHRWLYRLAKEAEALPETGK